MLPNERRNKTDTRRLKRFKFSWSKYPDLTPKLIKFLETDASARRWAFFLLGTGTRIERTRKTHYIQVLTSYLFERHPALRREYHRNPGAFELRTRNHLQAIKSKYQNVVVTLGPTVVSDVEFEAGSPHAKKLDRIKARYPWWDGINKVWNEFSTSFPIYNLHSGENINGSRETPFEVEDSESPESEAQSATDAESIRGVSRERPATTSTRSRIRGISTGRSTRTLLLDPIEMESGSSASSSALMGISSSKGLERARLLMLEIERNKSELKLLERRAELMASSSHVGSPTPLRAESAASDDD
ncbi:hypothetical protein SISNIDRAFT_482237 [Sistotremastrum niveocremeum HHB9708]|uniref:Uncharacterized protein n=1 Tax=Sistotremastrum niveocremeum HHB9708 TaxID=1314777 RepID=A0A164YX23_9AGAM|nr:hypothetical protein SISNIDRAFT_482237 [Sistotremastrum niveocremeum HHB9708]